MNNKSVYVMVNTSTKLVKIGVSDNPTKRAIAISASCGYDVKPVFVSDLISNPHECEKKCHNIMDSMRARGEWFKCAEYDAVKCVKSVVFDIGLDAEIECADDNEDWIVASAWWVASGNMITDDPVRFLVATTMNFEVFTDEILSLCSTALKVILRGVRDNPEFESRDSVVGFIESLEVESDE